MEKNDKLKKNTVLSAMSLFFQSGYSATLGFGANLLLTILLSPKIFGIYFTVLAIIAILNYFSDIGLAASLIQKKDITDDDIKTTFTIQQTLILTIVSIGFLASSFIQSFYDLPQEGIYLFWALLFAFFISSLKTIPSILLERKIQFQKIVIVQIVENTVFYITVMTLALLKYDLMSFTFAVILRSITGLILIYSLSFWVPKIGISIKSVKTLLSFGVPFQASSFLALFKDELLILYLGKILGFESLGYIGWAKKWAETPIRIIMDNISKVLFPVFSRIQHDTQKISRLIQKILFYQTTILAPSILGLALIMSNFIEIIPKYSKWAPALPLLYIFCISAFLSSYSTPFINMFNALGKVRISFKFMLAWTIATWVLTPILTQTFGLFGFPITLVILSSSFIIVVTKAKTLIQFSFIQSIIKPLSAAAVMGIIVFAILNINLRTDIKLIISILTGALSYFAILIFIYRINVINEVKSLFSYK